MTERQRLARIFGMEPLRPVGASVMAGGMAAIPSIPTWIASGTITLWLIGIFLDEQRKIREGLSEVTGWGFPIDGYREWLLAREPAFDLELSREVGEELIEASIAAVDSTITVQWRGRRVVRVLMRPIEIRGDERSPAFLAGDRKRLFELRDRILAPLHADVGISSMRMGDRDSLGVLVAARARSVADGDAFREQALVAPPDLQSLLQVGTSQPRPPREASTLDVRVDRLLFAIGHPPTSTGAMAAAVVGGMLAGFVLAPAALLAGAAAGSGIAHVMRVRDRGRLTAALAQVTEGPIRVEGYDDWLLSGRPICDVEFNSSPPNPGEIERRVRRIVRVAELTWLSPTVMRVESQPVKHAATGGIRPFWGGDPREIGPMLRVILAPLHKAHGIVVVRMGGYLDRRV